VSAYAGWVKQILDGLGIVKPVMIGHSLGAAICLTFAIRYGDAAAAVVPVGRGSEDAGPIRSSWKGCEMTPEPLSPWRPSFRREATASGSPDSWQSRSPGSIPRSSTVTSPPAMAWMSRRRSRGSGSRPWSSAGRRQDDAAIPVAVHPGRHPGAKLALIEGAGHFAMLENPATFNTLAGGFCQFVP